MIQIELLNSGLEPIFKRKRVKIKKPYISVRLGVLKWSHLGSNQGPSDYESDALTILDSDLQVVIQENEV